MLNLHWIEYQTNTKSGRFQNERQLSGKYLDSDTLQFMGVALVGLQKQLPERNIEM